MAVAGSHRPAMPMVVLSSSRPVISIERWPLNCNRLFSRFGTSPRLLKKLLTPVRRKLGVM
ncbi:hypothetical protein D3C85_1901160 [compost metagenome]